MGAGEYACSEVDMQSFLPLSAMGCGGDANDIWGWTDPQTHKEWAIVGCTDGTSFVDVTDAHKPLAVAWLPTRTTESLWRDIKVYKDHAFIVSEAYDHGMQVYDMTQLRALQPSTNMPTTVKASSEYTEHGSAHNIVINEGSGTAY